MRLLQMSFLVFGLTAVVAPSEVVGQEREPVVHAILFYSPTCPHCHQVINETLIPLQNRYGRRLVILGMDTSQSWANSLYWEAIRFYQVPENDWAVPFLVVGDEVLVGGLAIPSRFPAMIEAGLAAGGIDLPDFPALRTFYQEREMLDPRYPDRLIARQAQAPGQEEPPVPQDSAVVEDPGAVADKPGAVADEPGEAPDTVPDQAPPAAVDSAVAEIGEEPEGPREPVEEAQEAQTDTEVISEPMEAERAQPVEAERAPPVEDPGVPEATDSPQVSTGEGVGSLGLRDASRELEAMTAWDRFNMDPIGNSLSVLVLLGMLVSLVLRGYPPKVKGGEWPAWIIPVLVLIGTGAAAYLSFIEVTQTEAVCGPVGDCNTVNQSGYAFLFGFLPVGVFGLMGYGLIIALWVLRHTGPGRASAAATLGIWGGALFGTVFSVYLTFLEPFVIGATCAWCLTSAVVMTLLLWASGPSAARVWPRPEAGADSIRG